MHPTIPRFQCSSALHSHDGWDNDCFFFYHVLINYFLLHLKSSRHFICPLFFFLTDNHWHSWCSTLFEFFLHCGCELPVRWTAGKDFLPLCWLSFALWFPLLGRDFFPRSIEPYFSALAMISWAPGVLFRKSPRQYLEEFPLQFFASKCRVSGVTLRSLLSCFQTWTEMGLWFLPLACGFPVY